MEEACGGLGLSPLPPPSEREAGPASAALPPSCRGLWPGQVPAHQGSGAVAGFPHLGGDTLSQDPRVTKEVCASDLNACTATPVCSHSHTVYLHSHTCLLTQPHLSTHTVTPVYSHSHTCLLTQSHLSTHSHTCLPAHPHVSNHTVTPVYLYSHTPVYSHSLICLPAMSHLSIHTVTPLYLHSHTCLLTQPHLSTCNVIPLYLHITPIYRSPKTLPGGVSPKRPSRSSWMWQVPCASQGSS